MRSIRAGIVVLVLSAGLLVAGCGSTASPGTGGADTGSPSSHAGAVTVIRSWSNALRRGDVTAAARYFALPSEFADGGPAAVRIRTEAQAISVNSALSCGSRLISTRKEGRYVSALFRLTNRTGPGADCGSGAGQLARTDFLIAHGRIVQWIRAPVNDGIPATPTTPSSGQPNSVV